MTAPAVPPTWTATVRASLRRPGRAVPEWLTANAFLAIPMLFLTVMLLLPLGKEIWLSFTNARLTNPGAGKFVGLGNYRTLFASPTLAKVLANTLVYTLATMALSLLLGVSSALLVNRPFRGRALVRGVLAMPWAIPGVAASLIWLWMFKDDGVLNRALGGVGAPTVSWLASPHWAMVSVVVVTAWLFAPMVMLVTLAALQSVPSEVIDASKVDGAGRIATFRYVTWPHINPTVRLLGLLLTIWTLRRWDVITVLTNGGPVNSTSTVVVATQQQAFTYQQVGQGAAYAMIGIAIAAILATGYFLLERRELRNS